MVAASLGLMLAARSPGGAVLADLAGDLPMALGAPEPDSAGLAGWLAAGPATPADALGRIEIPVATGLGLLPRGAGSLPRERAEVLAALLEQGARPVVADCGLVAGLDDAAEVVALSATRSLLVTRPCFLALRRVLELSGRPTGVVVVREPGHRLGRADVEEAVGAPVVAEIETDPNVVRALDAGLLTDRLPRSLVRGLRRVA